MTLTPRQKAIGAEVKKCCQYWYKNAKREDMIEIALNIDKALPGCSTAEIISAFSEILKQPGRYTIPYPGEIEQIISSRRRTLMDKTGDAVTRERAARYRAHENLSPEQHEGHLIKLRAFGQAMKREITAEKFRSVAMVPLGIDIPYADKLPTT